MSGVSGLSGLGSFSINSISDSAAGKIIADGEESASFKNFLTDAIENSEALDDTSNFDTLSLLAGKSDNLSDVLINAEKSELAINLTVQIRNKAMEAYKEIMNMQV